VKEAVTGVAERMGLTGEHIENPHRPFVLLYVLAFIYVLVFRVIYDILPPHAETEYYPIEITTTIMVLLSIAVSYLIYLENRGPRPASHDDSVVGDQAGDDQAGEDPVGGGISQKETGALKQNSDAAGVPEPVMVLGKFRLDRTIILLFFMFYLAENNWLPGREFTIGTAIYGLFGLVVCKYILERLYHSNRTAFFLFVLGIMSMATGASFDAMTDGKLPFKLFDGDDLPFSRTLLEEVPELYASIFFLHSLFLHYLDTTRDHARYPIDRTATSVLLTSAVLCGVGNSFFLEDHGKPIELTRLLIGLFIFSTGALLAYRHFRSYRVPGSGSRPDT